MTSRQVLTIDSQFRRYAGDSVVSFRYPLTSPIRGVVGMRVVSLEADLDNQRIYPQDNVICTFTADSDGTVWSYGLKTLTAWSNDALADAWLQTPDSGTGSLRLSLYTDTNDNDQPIFGISSLLSTAGTVKFTAYGYKLGFNQTSYHLDAAGTGCAVSAESIPRWTTVSPYYYLVLENFGEIVQDNPLTGNTWTAFERLTRDEILRKVPPYPHEIHRYAPFTLSGFQNISLLDAEGRLVDCGGSGFSFGLELTLARQHSPQTFWLVSILAPLSKMDYATYYAQTKALMVVNRSATLDRPTTQERVVLKTTIASLKAQGLVSAETDCS